MRISVGDYPDQQGSDKDAARFKQEVAAALQAEPAEIELRVDGDRLVAVKDGDDVPLDFADANDQVRLLGLAKSSRSPLLLDFGLAPKDQTLKVKPLPEDRMAAVRQIKSSLVTALHVPVVDIRLTVEGQKVTAHANGQKVELSFAAGADGQRVLEWAMHSPTDKLVDFGRELSDKVLKVGPYTGLSDQDLVKRFLKDAEAQLGVKPESARFEMLDGEIRLMQVRDSKWALMADRLMSPVVKEGGIDIVFAERADYVRLVRLVAHSKSPVLTHLGKAPSERKITIPNYSDSLTRDEAIKRFQDDVARALSAPPEQIEVNFAGGMMEAKVRGKSATYDVLFKHPSDFERFSRWAVESRSHLLVDFGKRKIETQIDGSVTSGYPDPKGKLKLTQSINTEFYLGDSAEHRMRVGADLAQDAVSNPLGGLEWMTLGYHHTYWGGLDLRINPEGKLKVDNAESNFVTEAWGKYSDKLKAGDPKAILQAAGVVGGTAAALYGFSQLWPKTEKLDLPVSLKLYDNGYLSIRGKSDGTLSLGGGVFDYQFTGAGLGVRENIASGVSAYQTADYRADQNKLTVGGGLAYNRFAVEASQGIDTKAGKSSGTSLAVSQGVVLSDKWVGQVGVKQELDGGGKPIKPALNVGVQYQMNETWGFRAGVGVSSPDYKTKPDYAATLGVHLYL